MISDNKSLACPNAVEACQPVSGYLVNSTWSHLTIHDLRHTHATMLMKQGINPKVVQERLGHSSISITLDVYSHVIPGMQELASLQFDKGLKLSDDNSVISVRDTGFQDL